MKIITLKYGNTNTYFVGGLLIDTDMAGTMRAFLRELKSKGVSSGEIKYVLATHYHPDHMGLIGELMQSGVKLLLPDFQKEYVHFSDKIYAKNKNSGFVPVNEDAATVITKEESRAFLEKIGIPGEIIETKSHSQDGAALILDDGNAFVGDVEPRGFIDGYESNAALREDWDNIMRLGARVIHYGHANEETIGGKP
ncbi:MAG: MBL fold metallo-hydrolase [Clostridiales bacterium]|nr:MBL fold metallo-hydrolase [Clostridiales bacterium]